MGWGPEEGWVTSGIGGYGVGHGIIAMILSRSGSGNRVMHRQITRSALDGRTMHHIRRDMMARAAFTSARASSIENMLRVDGRWTWGPATLTSCRQINSTGFQHVSFREDGSVLLATSGSPSSTNGPGCNTIPGVKRSCLVRFCQEFHISTERVHSPRAHRRPSSSSSPGSIPAQEVRKIERGVSTSRWGCSCMA